MQSLLVVSAWGYPPSWFLYDYLVRIEHPAFLSRIKGFKCRSCCSTLVLASCFKSSGFEVDTVVFGLDTVVDPNVISDVRKRAEELYREWLNILVDRCDCCKDLDLEKVDIVVLPGIGSFYGWRFSGTIDHLFNKAFSYLVEKLRSKSYNWIFVDLTHGINYQMVAVLYATIASAILMDRDSRVLVMNSEPALRGGSRCIEVKTEITPIEKLNLLDVSRLQEAVNFIRMLTSLKGFRVAPLKKALKDLRKSDPSLVEMLEKRIVPFFELLGNAIIAPTYRASYIATESDKKPLGIDICSSSPDIEMKTVEYRPTIDRDRKEIRYESASIYQALRYTIKIFVEKICKELKANDFLEYLDKVKSYYEDQEHIYGELIAHEVKESLSFVAKYVEEFRNDIPREHIDVNGDRLVISSVLYRALASNIHTVRRSLEEKHNLLNISETLQKAMDIHKKEVEVLRRAKEVDLRYIRHMVAHGGLEYATLRGIVIEKGKVVEIVFDKELLYKVLRRILGESFQLIDHGSESIS